MPKLLDEGRPPICDLVSIDGAHTYQNVLADVTYLSRLARPGAPFLIDDVCDPAGCETELPSVRLPCRHVASLWLPCPHQGPAWQADMHDPRNYQYTGGLWADARVVRPGAVRADARRGRAVRAAQQPHLCDAARPGRRRLLAFDDGAANNNTSIIAAATAAAAAATRRRAENACAAAAAAADVHAWLRRAQLHWEVRQAPSAAVETRGVVVARATSGDAARVLCWLSWYCLGG